MQVKRVNIADLKLANYNPESRTVSSAGLNRLRKSIETTGLFYPILVSKDNEVIDGHRRIAACTELGWDTIPALVANGSDACEIYAEVNANTNRLGGLQLLQVWLAEPTAVTKSMQGQFETAEATLGRPMLERLAKQGLSLLTFRRAREIAGYVGKEGDSAFVRKCVAWLVKHHGQTLVHHYIKMSQSPKALFKAITGNKELKAQYTA